MNDTLRATAVRWLAAPLFVAAAATFTAAVPALRNESQTPLFFAAVLATTWVAGPGAGLFATGLAAIAIDYLFIVPTNAVLSSSDDVVRLAVFVGVASSIGMLDAARRRANAGVRRSEARFRRLTDSRLVGVHVATHKGALVEANDAFLELVGYTRDDLRSGAIDLDLMTPAEHLDLDAHAYLETEARGVSTPYEKEYVRKDGSRAPVLTGSARLEDPPGAAIWLTLDLSATKRAERALRQSEERFYQAQRLDAIGRLAGGIAHNFNNLLTVIIGHCSLLDRVEHDDRRRADVDAIRTAADRAATLTRQLLAYTRRQAFRLTAVDLEASISELSAMVESVLGNNVTLVARSTPSLGRARADAAQVQQVLLNLVLNARDAMPDGGTITIETANVDVDAVQARRLGDLAEGLYVTVTVRDTGCGMDPETKARAFEPFFTTKGVRRGTGLGLASVYGIVKQSGGTVAVESRLGAGSAFTVFLPTAEVTSPAVGAGSKPGFGVKDASELGA